MFGFNKSGAATGAAFLAAGAAFLAAVGVCASAIPQASREIDVGRLDAKFAEPRNGKARRFDPAGFPCFRSEDLIHESKLATAPDSASPILRLAPKSCG